MSTTLKPSRILTHRETILAVCDEDNSLWRLLDGSRKPRWEELPKIERPDPPTPEALEWSAAFRMMPRNWQMNYRFQEGSEKRVQMKAEALAHYRQFRQERNP